MRCAVTSLSQAQRLTLQVEGERLAEARDNVRGPSPHVRDPLLVVQSYRAATAHAAAIFASPSVAPEKERVDCAVRKERIASKPDSLTSTAVQLLSAVLMPAHPINTAAPQQHQQDRSSACWQRDDRAPGVKTGFRRRHRMSGTWDESHISVYNTPD